MRWSALGGSLFVGYYPSGMAISILAGGWVILNSCCRNVLPCQVLQEGRYAKAGQKDRLARGILVDWRFHSLVAIALKIYQRASGLEHILWVIVVKDA